MGRTVCLITPFLKLTHTHTHASTHQKRARKTHQNSILHTSTRGTESSMNSNMNIVFFIKYLKLLLLLGLTDVFFLCFFVSITLVFLCICVSCIVFFSFTRSLFVVSCLYPFLVVFTLRYTSMYRILQVFFSALLDSELVFEYSEFLCDRFK